MTTPRRFAIGALVALAAFSSPAYARSASEAAYDAFVHAVAARGRELPTSDGTRRWEARLASAKDVRALAIALDQVVAALAKEAPADRPRALELDARLAKLRRGLAMATALGVDPGELLVVTVRLIQDAGGWDSVVWGEKAYPAASGDVVLQLRVPRKWVPSSSRSDPVFTACEQAVFHPLRNDEIVQSPERWAAYLEEAKRLVPAALRTAHLPKLPEELVVLDPPDSVFSRAMDPMPGAWPFPVRTVPVSEWAAQTPTRGDGPERRKAFQDAWVEIANTTYAREYRGNCALLVEKLVVEPLDAVVTPMLTARRHRLLGAWVKPYVLRSLPLREAPAMNAPAVARLQRGEAVESIAGVSAEQETGQVTLERWVRVRTASGVEGWVPNELILGWRGGTGERTQTLAVLDIRPPDALAADVAQLDQQASVWRGASLASKHPNKAKAAAAAAQARTSLDYFCRLKARLEHEAGAEQMQAWAEHAARKRQAAGESASAVDSLFDATWRNPECGATSAAAPSPAGP